MTSLTHGLAGYAIGKLVESKTSVSPKPNLLTGIATVSALIPDLDYFVSENLATHHQHLTHAPLTWFVSTGLLWLFGKVLHNNLITTISYGLGIGTISHMLMDTSDIAIGIAWLAPFSWKEYSFFTLHPEYGHPLTLWAQEYLRSPAFFVELLTIAVFIFILWKLKESYSTQ